MHYFPVLTQNSRNVAAYRRVAVLLAAESNVIGFDSMNEPNLDMIGWKNL